MINGNEISVQEPIPSTCRPLAPFVAYVLMFFVVWSILWVWNVYPWAIRLFGDATLAYALVNLGFRFAIWVAPVLWYLRQIDHFKPIEYLRLRLFWERGVAIGLTVSVINFLLTAWRSGLPHVHTAYITWNSVLSTSIFVGFFEEVPFRGFILQKLEERFTFWTAALTSSILFVGIHIPGWVLLGTLTGSNVAFIFLFGMLMAVLLRFSKSLWAPIVTHSLNDFISGVLFHG